MILSSDASQKADFCRFGGFFRISPLRRRTASQEPVHAYQVPRRAHQLPLRVHLAHPPQVALVELHRATQDAKHRLDAGGSLRVDLSAVGIGQPFGVASNRDRIVSFTVGSVVNIVVV